MIDLTNREKLKLLPEPTELYDIQSISNLLSGYWFKTHPDSELNASNVHHDLPNTHRLQG